MKKYYKIEELRYEDFGALFQMICLYKYMENVDVCYGTIEPDTISLKSVYAMSVESLTDVVMDADDPGSIYLVKTIGE